MLDWQQFHTWKILVVDDEPDNRAIVVDVLEFHKMTVQVAKDGKEGLEKLETFMPTLILLDLSMPTMDGWEMLSRVKAMPEYQTIPVVALTAHAMSEDKKRVFDAGFDGYLKKPIKVISLINDLRATIEERIALRKFQTGETKKISSPGN